MARDVTPAGYPRRGYEHFDGVVAEHASESTPSWPAPRRARPGAPNVVVVLVDDLGFSDIAPFGAEIDTPSVTGLAGDGYRFTNFHATPLCSPSRAALLTGLNPHRAGFGYVVHSDPGYPGHSFELANDVPTLAESLRAGGYATFMVGKWHLTKESRLHDGADKDSWPLQHGFDRYYGSMDGFTSLFHPHRIVSDNGPTRHEQYPDDFYLTDALTDRAIEMIDGLRTNDPSKPFFLYFAHQAVHGPLQAKPADIEKYRGTYDAGWDHVRNERFRRQLRGGLFPESTRMSPSGPDETLGVPSWDELDDQRQALFARHMEVYAAAVDAVDQSLGRIASHLKAIGEYENTIMVFTSDNGATGEGGLEGTRSYFSQFTGMAGLLPDDWCTDVPRDLELLGGPRVHGHYPRGWAHVSNTPFRYYKFHTYAGGIHVPFVLSWLAGLPRSDGDAGLRQQYAYITDVAPTLLALTGVPRLEQRHGNPVKDVDGVAFDHLLRDGTLPTRHHSQYVECGGQRGYFEDGFKAIAPHERGTPFTDDGWELYDITTDPAETVNLAARMPEKVAELAEKWRAAAWLNTVFPLDDTGQMSRVRPSTELKLSEPVTIRPGTPTLERFRSSRLTLLRSFTIEASVRCRTGDEGVIVAHGDQGGGYVLYVEDGALGFTYNAYGEPTRIGTPWRTDTGAPVTITVRFSARAKMRWSIELVVDDEVPAYIHDVPQLLGMAPFTGISVGFDDGGPVDWELHERHGTFRFSGELTWVRYTPGPKAEHDPEIIVPTR